MIISKTPYRISLFGGGSDLPQYFNRFGGEVIGFAINQYSYLFLKKTKKMLGYNYRIVYSKHEIKNKLNDIDHPSVRETLKYYNFKKGIELTHNGDLPALSGMGSSSSFTVGLCNILQTLKKKKFDNYELAYDAIDIEQNKIREAVGSQDQTFAAFGGLNKIDFLKNGKINVISINLSQKNKKILEQSSLLVFTGKVRYASNIEKKKIANINKNKNKVEQIHSLKKMVSLCYKELTQDQINIKKIGQMLNKSWKLKSSLSSDVTNKDLNEIYNIAIKNGAYGGKLLGAGGGGFFYFLCNPKKKEKIKKKLKLKTLDIKIDNDGSQVIFNDFT